MITTPRNNRSLIAFTLVLLLAAVMMILHVDDLSMWFDELWAVMHSQGSIESILLNRDVNWPPAYYLALHVWTNTVGFHDFTIKLLGAFCGLLATAFVIGSGRQLGGNRAGWLAGLAFAASDYALYFILEVRGYTLMLALLTATVYFHLRWFARPTLRRALPYLLAQTALVYTQFTSGLIVVLLGLRVLLATPRRQQGRVYGQWFAIMLATGLLFLPLVPQFIIVNRANTNVIRQGAQSGGGIGFIEGFTTLFQAYSAHQDAVFAALLVLAAAGWLKLGFSKSSLRVTPITRRVWLSNLLWLLAWAVGVPLFAYLALRETRLFSPRYLIPTMPGMALWLGVGLAGLRGVSAHRADAPAPTERGLRRRNTLSPLTLAAAALLLALWLAPWQPFDYRPRYDDVRPVRDVLRQLAARAQPGDALVVDPLCFCDDVYNWWVYERIYFPNGGLPRADAFVQTAPRVWYVTVPGQSDGGVRARVEHGRIAAVEPEYWWQSLYLEARLFIAPPAAGLGATPGGYLLSAPPESTTAGESARFLGYELPNGILYEPGTLLVLHTWWSVDAPLTRDYSIGVSLINRRNGLMLTQADSGPQGIYTPPGTSAWLPGQVYRDTRTLRLPQTAGAGFYEVQLVLYYWEDGLRFLVESGAPTTADGALLLDVIEISTFNLPD